jgi:hypothetical protein
MFSRSAPRSSGSLFTVEMKFPGLTADVRLAKTLADVCADARRRQVNTRPDTPAEKVQS